LETGQDKEKQFYDIIGNLMYSPHMEILIEEEIFHLQETVASTTTTPVTQYQPENSEKAPDPPDPPATTDGSTSKSKTKTTPKTPAKSKGSKKSHPKSVMTTAGGSRSIIPIPQSHHGWNPIVSTFL
jgi:hypothetical protein